LGYWLLAGSCKLFLGQKSTFGSMSCEWFDTDFTPFLRSLDFLFLFCIKTKKKKASLDKKLKVKR
jgi:hypothetical protein